MVRDTTRPYKLCTIPDMIVRATFHDQQCTGICLTACSVVDTWELSNPSNYQAMISYIDSGTAVMTTDAKYAIYNPNIPWQAGKSLILFDADKINSINNYDGRKKKSGLNGLFDITLEDDEYETLTGRKPNGSTSINNVIGNMAPGVDVGRVEDFMNKPEENGITSRNTKNAEIVKGRQDITCCFTAPTKSNTLITSQILGKDVVPTYEAASGKFNIDADTRFPSKILPIEYDGIIGYATLHNEICRQSEEFMQVPTKVGNINYHFYQLDSKAYSYYPDILPEVVSSERALQDMVNLTGKVKIVINGMKNMFNADDPEERIEILKKMYANFFLLTKYFTITHISWKTGFISALTPNYNQVLIYASIKNDDVRDGLFTFIPIKKNIGISVAGLDRDEIIDLENIWLNVSKE